MKRSIKLLALLPLLALAAACVNVRATPLGPQAAQYPPVMFEQVVVYETEDDIPAEYEKLAVLFADGEANWTNERQMVDAARKKAGRIGANAIVIGEFKEPSSLAQVAGVIFDAPVSRRARFLAVRIRTDAES